MSEPALHLNLLLSKLLVSVDGPAFGPKTSELTSRPLYLHPISYRCQLSLQYAAPSPSCLLFSITSASAQTTLIVSLLPQPCLSVISSQHNQSHRFKHKSWNCMELHREPQAMWYYWGMSVSEGRREGLTSLRTETPSHAGPGVPNR